jgi:uncharacterized Fe-S center protein
MRPEIESDIQVRHAEAVGLGSREYELVRVK